MIIRQGGWKFRSLEETEPYGAHWELVSPEGVVSLTRWFKSAEDCRVWLDFHLRDMTQYGLSSRDRAALHNALYTVIFEVEAAGRKSEGDRLRALQKRLEVVDI